jgi:acetylornithine deacetylase
MMKLKHLAYEFIDNNIDDLITFLQEMISHKSVYLNEEGMQKYMACYLAKMGGNIDMWYPDIDQMRKHPAFCVDRENFDTSPIVVGEFKGCGGGKSLIINGHVDVVPEGDNWDFGPYEGKLVDGIIYGRGANDMKGGFAAAIFALKAVLESGIKLKGDILVESVIDEEVGSSGALATVLRGYRADGAIIPEPTQYELVPANQGSTFFRISVKGKKAHGAYHYLGVNAIKKAHFIMDKLDELEELRQKDFYNDLFSRFKIQAPISVGKFSSGTWPSMSPDLAVMEGRYGITTSETVEEAKKYFEDFIYEACKEDHWLRENPPIIQWMEHWNSGSTSLDSDIVQTVIRSYKEMENEEPVITGWAAPTDLSILTRYGNIPTLVFGPGNESLHKNNEYIEVEDLRKYAKHMVSIIIDWCGVIS